MRRTSLAAALLAAGLAVTGLALAPTATSSSPAIDEVASMIRVHTPTREARQLVANLGLDLSEDDGADYVGVVLHGLADADLLRAAGLSWTVQIADLDAREAERRELDAAYAAAADSPTMPSGRKAYRSLADYEWDMKELAKRNPGLVKLIKLPHPSVEGRTVWGLEITDHVADKDGKPAFAIMGTHHAREWTAGEHTIEFAFDLVKTWNAGDARTHDLLRRARVLVVPIVNVDGFNVSYEQGQLIDGQELQDPETRGDGTDYTVIQQGPQGAYKRKNCRLVDGVDTPAGACQAPGSRYIGVDNNRNYGALWGGAGASALPADDIYHGSAPFSEPETQNIRELVSSNQVTMLVTNHTFAGLVLRAPGVKDQGVTVDEPAMRDVGAAMAAANGSVNQAGYQLYDTTGTTEDWSYNATGGFGYTFEIPVREFHPPYAETVGAYNGVGKLAGLGNRAAFYIALESAANPVYHSVIATDAPVGAVLRLTKSFDTLSSPVRAAETQFTTDPGLEGAVIASKDRLNVTMVSGGHNEWHVNPSTRPAVMERKVYDVSGTPSSTWTKEGTPPVVGSSVDVPFHLGDEHAGEKLDITLDWPTPDDLDLEVYRKVGATLQDVGSSGNSVGDKEQVTLDDAAAGDYVLRVVNFASATPSYSLTAATYPTTVTKVHPASKPYETWALSCERPDGTVLQRVDVLVSRGDRVVIDLAACRQAWGA
jgi:hypothetical protein